MIRQEIGDVPYSDETINSGIHRGLGLETDKAQTTLLEQEEERLPRLTPSDLILNPDAKTGYAVFDNLHRER